MVVCWPLGSLSGAAGLGSLMRLLRVRVQGIGPFADLSLSFVRQDGTLRNTSVIFGGDGVGKTTLLAALGVTRPGMAMPPSMGARTAGVPAFAATEWDLGDDDLARPHPLVVASPAAVLEGETPDLAMLRRREQAIFDKKAQEAGGFVFVAFSGARWFSRTPNMLTTPDRTVLRYDVRASTSFDDATRADLTRETKQVLSYVCVRRALSAATERDDAEQLEAALRETLGILLQPYGLRWTGASPRTLEPTFERGRVPMSFDELPKGAKHLAAMGALTVRALAGAYAERDEPIRDNEGVCVIDDLESQQDPGIQRELCALLHEALPRVQWVVSTSQVAVTQGQATSDVLSLRPGDNVAVELHEGPLH